VKIERKRERKRTSELGRERAGGRK